MKISENYLSEAHSWEKVRNDIKRLDPKLAGIIDEINPDDSHFFYPVDYTYGSEIVKDGFLQLPTQKGLIKFPDLPTAVQKEFGYNGGSNPITFVLKNTCELFIILPNRIVPFSIASPGDLFGLTKIIDRQTSFYPDPEMRIWGLTAGARDIFLLPKITEHASHEKLRKKFHLNIDKPQDLLSQWQIFREIIKQDVKKSVWDTSLLLFNQAWFTHFDDPAWMPFNYYLQQKVINNTSFWRNEYLFRLMFSRIHHKFNINPTHHIADTVKYLIQVTLGVLPGFVPATDNSCAPIDIIQQVYMDVYNIPYAPTIMHPAYFSLKKESLPVYASLQHNGAIELSLKTSSKKTILTDLYEIYSLVQKYQTTMKQQENNLSISALTSLGSDIIFKFFHGHVEEYVNIISTEKLPTIDPRFTQQFPTMPFAYKSHFLNGCIQISKAE